MQIFREAQVSGPNSKDVETAPPSQARQESSSAGPAGVWGEPVIQARGKADIGMGTSPFFQSFQIVVFSHVIQVSS